LPSFPAGHAVEVTIGRALLFSVDVTCRSPFGQYLGLQGPDEYNLIHTNYNIETRQVENIIPWCVIGDGQLLLGGSNYAFMRIEPSDKPVGTISSNLTFAIGSVNYGNIENSGEEESYFAEIIFAGTSPGDVITKTVGGEHLFYDAPLVKLIDLDISFHDVSGNILELKQDHSFTLQMIELREILKDTLIDSRTGTIADIGSGITTVNPLD
jgi:hypothetical protein